MAKFRGLVGNSHANGSINFSSLFVEFVDVNSLLVKID